MPDRFTRKAERITGYSVIEAGKQFIAIDGAGVILATVTANSTKRGADLLVEEIYRLHSRKVREKQKHRCLICGHLGKLEIDHIESRGRNGRNDRIENLRGVCSPFSGGCDFHRKRHGG